MNTATVGIRDFRKNISKYTKDQDKSFVVTVRNQPAFEVKPCVKDKPETDLTQSDYYKSVETALAFWDNKNDDNIFQT